jgi:hypothetical protein
MTSGIGNNSAGRRHGETALWSVGTFARAYAPNRRVAIEDAIDAAPVAACVRELMAERSSWVGSAADLLRASADHSRDGMGSDRTGWPQNPRALAGRLRRAQTSLRALGIEIAFTREGRAGSRIIRMYTSPEDTVRTVSDNAKPSGSGPPPLKIADDVGAGSHRAHPTGLASVMTGAVLTVLTQNCGAAGPSNVEIVDYH